MSCRHEQRAWQQKREEWEKVCYVRNVISCLHNGYFCVPKCALCVGLHHESTLQRQLNPLGHPLSDQNSTKAQTDTPRAHFWPRAIRHSSHFFPTGARSLHVPHQPPRPADFNLSCNLNAVQRDFREWLEIQKIVRVNDSMMLCFETRQAYMQQ